MIISKYLKMNSEGLAKEIQRQNQKIKTSQETIKLLRKLQIAESAKGQIAESERMNTNDSPFFHANRFGNDDDQDNE